ncbi:MAG TPA: hypothetical protein VFQ59_01705 [Candidatus Paceibacterota bacterium]|nr:hypothetical protein [Candidatus Paceibacterota bacterium]
MEPETNTAPKKSNGALIGSIIIILILIIGGIYLLGRTQEGMEVETPNLETDTLSESDELESIEADLEGEVEIELTNESAQ